MRQELIWTVIAAASQVLRPASAAAEERPEGRPPYRLEATTDAAGISLPLAPRWSLRMTAGVGFLHDSDPRLTLGSALRFELSPGRRLQPYMGATLRYHRDAEEYAFGLGTTTRTRVPNSLSLGPVVGLRTSFGGRVGVYAEATMLHSTRSVVDDIAPLAARLDGRNWVQVDLGLTFRLGSRSSGRH
jgi:hypothetical protein